MRLVITMLCGGAIGFERERKNQAAGLWFAGSIGPAAGLGFWHIRRLATTLSLTVLWRLHRLERRVVSKPTQTDDLVFGLPLGR